MARKPKTDRVWFENFNLEAEITALITRIERCTKFELPDKKREMAFSYAATKLGKTKEAYADACRGTISVDSVETGAENKGKIWARPSRG